MTVTATNAHGTVSRTFTGGVLAPPSAIGGTVPQLMLGDAASTTLTADGHPAPTFAVTAGVLPAGVSLDPTTGVLAGTPLATGSWSATVTATNSRGSVDRVLGGHVGDPPSAVTGVLPALVWSSPVAVVLASSGYPAPTFAVTAGALPAGLSLDAVTGAVTGTPTVAGAYSVTITASNEHGTADVTFSGSVTPILPGAPWGLTTEPGDEAATVAFHVPASDGGSPVTGYEVSVDGGPWQALATTADGSWRTGSVSGLVNGVEVVLRVRAVTAVGRRSGERAGGRRCPSRRRRRRCPRPAPWRASPRSPWRGPPSTERDVTGYTVTAYPGSATCTTTVVETSCVLGATAGVPVTYTVVTHSRWGDSVPSAPSQTVVPDSPAVPDARRPPPPRPRSPRARATSPASGWGRRVTVIGTGFAPYSTATVVVYSTPRVLGTVVTDGTGAFAMSVIVPTDLEPGQHTFVAYGVEPSGAEHTMRLPVTVPSATAYLASTGAGAGDLMLLTLALLTIGAALRVASVRLGAPASARAR